MSKLFMYGTSLERIEQLMVLVPNFQPTKSGIIINNYFNCKGGVKDCNCNVLNVSNRCNDCGYIHSDILSNVEKMGYKNLVKEYFGKIKNYSLKDRLKLLTNNFKGEIFLNPKHKERFYNAFHKQDIDIYYIYPRYIAILFLLTADDMLWKISEYTGKEYIKINEIADADLIDDMTFKAIINSALIVRYEQDIFLITK